MTDKQEPIDLLKRRTEKLLEQERHRKQGEESPKQLDWPGAKFRDEAKTVRLSEELLDRLKIMVRVIAANVKEATSIEDVERACFGLALLLLKDHDKQGYEKLLDLVRQDRNGL